MNMSNEAPIDSALLPEVQTATEELRTDNAALDEMTQGAPDFLTKNSRGRYVIQDIADCERYEAEQTLLAQLDYGKRMADERGTLTTEQVRAIFGETGSKSN